jgi:predicted phage terminase large subunit-like protein
MGPGNFVSGPHIRGICDAVNHAVAEFERGVSTFLLIEVPFRHGKSVLVSRYLPAYLLGRCGLLEPSVLLSGYGATLVHDASQDCRRLVASPRFRNVFPAAVIDQSCRAVDNWRLDNSSGRVVAVGLGGAMTGRGYHLGVLDDYCKNRAEAESPAFRDGVWASFTNDFLTRRQNPSITIVCATPWHIDGIGGRIRARMAQDPNFPAFACLRFPATNPDGTYLWENYLGVDWYKGHYASLTPYEAAGLLDCDPQIRSGGMFDVTRFKITPAGSVNPQHVVQAVRYWDKAATAGGGCFSSGVLLLVTRDRRLIVYDVARGQWDTAERERKQLECAQADKAAFPMVRNTFEQEPGSGGVDSARLTVANMAGYAVDIDKVTGSKESRALPWSSQVNAGRVELVQAVWNGAFVDEHRSFPSGKYKDSVDAAAGAFSATLRKGGSTASGGIFVSQTAY